MKKLDTSACNATTIGFPPKQGTWDFLQMANQELFSSIIQGLIGPTYDPAKVYILYGMKYTSSMFFGTISAGAVYTNGEVFLSPAQGVPGAILYTDAVVAYIAESQYTTNADPVTFTDGISRNVHNIRQVGLTVSLAGSGTLNGGPSSNNDYGNFVPITLLNYAATPTFTTVALSAGASSGTLHYYVNPITNTIQLKGNLSVNVSSLAPTGTGPYYYYTVTLPSGCIPSVSTPFSCYYRYHTAPILDDTSLDHIVTINAELAATGDLSFGLIKAASNYTLYFNVLIPLS